MTKDALDNWPKHPNGRNMKIGEMSAEQRRAVTKAACKRLEREFAHPLVQEKINAVLNGDNVRN